MAEYICREEVLRKFIEGDGHDDDRFTEGYNFAVQEYREDIKNIPAADVQPVKHGRWTYPYKDKDINQCSECHSLLQDKISNVREMFAYCPFCGARMDIIYEDDKVRAIKVTGWGDDTRNLTDCNKTRYISENKKEGEQK